MFLLYIHYCVIMRYPNKNELKRMNAHIINIAADAALSSWSQDQELALLVSGEGKSRGCNSYQYLKTGESRMENFCPDSNYAHAISSAIMSSLRSSTSGLENAELYCVDAGSDRQKLCKSCIEKASKAGVSKVIIFYKDRLTIFTPEELLSDKRFDELFN